MKYLSDEEKTNKWNMLDIVQCECGYYWGLDYRILDSEKVEFNCYK